MNVTSVNLRCAAVLSGLALAGALIAPPSTALAAAPPPIHIVQNIVLNPGQAVNIPLPALPGFPMAPIQVLISKASARGVQQPSSVFAGVVSFDPATRTLSWTGTNSDGSPTSGNTLPRAGAPAPIVATMLCGAPPCWVARLFANGAANSLILRQNAATTTVPSHYVVTLWE